MDWSDIVVLGGELPEVTESTCYHTPSLKVSGKNFCRLRTEAEGGLMLFCSREEKEALLARGGAFYTTPHYDGYASILVDLVAVDPEELRELLTESWRVIADPRTRWSVRAPSRPHLCDHGLARRRATHRRERSADRDHARHEPTRDRATG